MMWSPSFLSTLLLLCVGSDSFAPARRESFAPARLMMGAPKSNGAHGSAGLNHTYPVDNGSSASTSSSEYVTLQSNTRFSAFAPDPHVETGDFRATLKENMKADLERRRRESPNRGNQPAKHYLDSL